MLFPTLFLSVFLSVSVTSGPVQAGERTPLFECVSEEERDHAADRILIFSPEEDRRSRHLGQVFSTRPMPKAGLLYSAALNLESLYQGKVLNFSGAGLRARINVGSPRARDGKYPAFIQVHEYGVYSNNWVCKRRDIP